MDSVFIGAQLIGLAAMALAVSAWQLKNPRHIILCFVPTNMLWAIQYMMLGAPLGALMNLCSVAKDSSLFFMKDSYVPYIIGTFLIVAWGVGLYNFAQWYDILPLIGVTIINTALLNRDNRSLYARSCIISCTFWLAYNLIVHSYVGATCSCFVIISSVIGMARHEGWILGKCHKTFMPSLLRSLFVFPNWRTYP